MSTPMWSLPDHLYVPVDKVGDGPAPPEEAVAVMCWCGDPDCEFLPRRDLPTGF